MCHCCVQAAVAGGRRGGHCCSVHLHHDVLYRARGRYAITPLPALLVSLPEPHIPEGATGGSTVAARGRCVEVVFVPWDPSALQIPWRSQKGSMPLRAVRGAAAGAERRGRLRLMPGGGVAPASTPLARPRLASRSLRSVCGAVCGACVGTGGGKLTTCARHISRPLCPQKLAIGVIF